MVQVHNYNIHKIQSVSEGNINEGPKRISQSKISERWKVFSQKVMGAQSAANLARISPFILEYY